MLFACISDIHLDQKTPYWSDHIAAIRRIIKDAADHGVDAFLLGGDMAGRTTGHRLTDLERETWADLLIEMAEHAAVRGIIGNHCRAGDYPIMAKLRARHSILVATKPMMTMVGDQQIALRPYQAQPEITGLSDLPIEQRNAEAGRIVLGKGDRHTICVAHFPAEGATFGSYEVQAAQDVTLSRQALDESGYAFIHLGHIHARQQVAERAYYPGSPVPLSFGESGPKGYNLVEVVVGEQPSVEFRAITSWRMETIRVPVDRTGDKQHLLAGLNSGAWDHLTPAHLRVIVELPADFHGDVPRREIKDLLTRAGALSVQVDTEKPEQERSRSAAVVAAQTDDDRLRAALAEQRIVDTEADRLVGVSNEAVRTAEEQA